MKIIGIAILLALGVTVPALAQTQRPALPWDKDLAVLAAAQPDLQKAGLRALASHADAFEAALKDGAQFFPNGAVVDGHQYVLADGSTESLLVTLAAAADRRKNGEGLMPVTAVANFYPLIGLSLGSYYDEMDRPDDAIRVLDEGLALSPAPESAMGAHTAEMLSEKGYALGIMKKYDEALAIYDQALAVHVLTPANRGHLYRGKGFILTEMGKLDEAEAAYKTSLENEPGNRRAEQELAYIAHLKAGGDTRPIESVIVPSSTDQPPAPK